ncbi:hypothetical protein ACFX10_012886 [Malus domestica]
MFKFKNGYCKVNVDDVQHIFGIPNRGREALQSTRDSRIPKPKENRFVDKYFLKMTRIGRREIAQTIQVAFNIAITKEDQDAACLIILYLLNTNLFGSSTGKLPWSLAKNCNSIDNINQYNEANETARYLMESINRTHKRKRDKIREKFQILQVEKISLEELVKKQQEEISKLNKTLGFINEVEPKKEEKTEKPVHQDSATISATESESEDKIVIASDQELDIQSK